MCVIIIAVCVFIVVQTETQYPRKKILWFIQQNKRIILWILFYQFFFCRYSINQSINYSTLTKIFKFFFGVCVCLAFGSFGFEKRIKFFFWRVEKYCIHIQHVLFCFVSGKFSLIKSIR